MVSVYIYQNYYFLNKKINLALQTHKERSSAKPAKNYVMNMKKFRSDFPMHHHTHSYRCLKTVSLQRFSKENNSTLLTVV